VYSAHRGRSGSEVSKKGISSDAAPRNAARPEAKRRSRSHIQKIELRGW
jgi:hypothetical protein